MRKIRVMIIEDSLTLREILCHIINSDPRLEVVSVCETAEQALKLLHKIGPDVISLDIRLPGMSGFEATLQIMADRPTPIVVIASNIQSDEMNISLNALRAGALMVLEKPAGLTQSDYAVSAKKICDQLALMSSVKVVRQRMLRNVEFSTTPKDGVADARKKSNRSGLWKTEQMRMLGVVASTGGPSALVTLFQGLPADFPAPIALVQHITDSFLESFVAWLAQNCPFKVKIAFSDELAKPGTIYVAPADHHLEVNSKGLLLTTTPPLSVQRPSGTRLFTTMAATYGDAAMGVLLTGMGDDGAAGLLDLQRAGSYTIAESESTAVVYGMPAVAVKLGAVCESLPLPEISPRILELLSINNGSRHAKSA